MSFNPNTQSAGGKDSRCQSSRNQNDRSCPSDKKGCLSQSAPSRSDSPSNPQDQND